MPASGFIGVRGRNGSSTGDECEALPYQYIYAPWALGVSREKAKTKTSLSSLALFAG
jgi:hypothetical protein